jgi:hypothetical protein
MCEMLEACAHMHSVRHGGLLKFFCLVRYCHVAERVVHVSAVVVACDFARKNSAEK